MLSWFVFSREREAPTHVRPIDPPYVNVGKVAEHMAFYAVFTGMDKSPSRWAVNCLMNVAK
jgi:hypothetical protein